MKKRNPIILIHGLWNNSSIFSSISSKLDDIGIEYFAPTLEHSYGMTSILDLTNKLNELILEKYGLEKEIDILGIIDQEFKLSKVKIILTKCNPPITGFGGKVSIVRILENN